MKQLLKQALSRAGIRITRTQSAEANPHQQVVSLAPKGQRTGKALLSYRIEPFLLGADDAILNDHTNYWETMAIAQLLLDRGYAVDAISYRNNQFVPTDDYAIFIGARTNFQRLTGSLPPSCVKVAHLDTAHWLTNNQAAYSRLLQLRDRRKVSLYNRKLVEQNWALEHADMGTVLGNEFTLESYRYAGKPLYRIPISAPTLYDQIEDKDYQSCRNRFLWFGSDGFVHKGLDLVVEAFAEMPDHSLTICGPLDQEPAFVEAYRHELYNLPNIHTVGWVDVNGPELLDIARTHAALIYPTCSEGGGGSVIGCMHLGLIPVVTAAASVDVGDSGIIVEEASIESVAASVRKVSAMSATELESLSLAAWQRARAHHTRDIFRDSFAAFLESAVIPLCKQRQRL